MLSNCTVPDEFLKTCYHAFCPRHSTEITLVKITDSSVPISLRNTSYKWPVPTCKKLFCLRLRDTRISYFIWCCLFPALVFPRAQVIYASQNSALGPPLSSLHHLITYHGNSLHFNCISEVILKFISPGGQFCSKLQSQTYIHTENENISDHEKLEASLPDVLFQSHIFPPSSK